MRDELERIAERCSDPEEVRRQCNQQAAAPSQQDCYRAWNATHPQQAYRGPPPIDWVRYFFGGQE